MDMSTGLIQKEIDGKTYEFQKFGAKQSLKVLLRIAKMVGKPAVAAFGSVKKSEGSILDQDIDGGIIAMAVGSLVENMDTNETLDLIEELTGKDKVLCDGKKIHWDSHYADLEHLFKVLKAALEVQYGNFFNALGASPALKPNPVMTSMQAQAQ